MQSIWYGSWIPEHGLLRYVCSKIREVHTSFRLMPCHSMIILSPHIDRTKHWVTTGSSLVASWWWTTWTTNAVFTKQLNINASSWLSWLIRYIPLATQHHERMRRFMCSLGSQLDSVQYHAVYTLFTARSISYEKKLVHTQSLVKKRVFAFIAMRKSYGNPVYALLHNVTLSIWKAAHSQQRNCNNAPAVLSSERWSSETAISCLQRGGDTRTLWTYLVNVDTSYVNCLSKQLTYEVSHYNAHVMFEMHICTDACTG